MKITDLVLSIPPFISTSWKNIASIQMNSNDLLEIYLNNGTKVSVKNLTDEQVQKIFHFHGESIEQSYPPLIENPFGITMKNAGIVLSGMESFTGMMQHDPSQIDAPTLPVEILSKISEMGKAVGIDKNTFNIPEGEPHCNCPYCQISRAIHGIEREDRVVTDGEIDVSNEELRFKEWNVHQKNDKLYQVTNPLDQHEQYSVYLGDPIGCTCGKNNCEHILAVLKS
jgi:hypothetical protein